MKNARVLTAALAALLALPALAAPAEAAVRPRIQGVVLDQGGRYVDDVTVVAERPDGSVAASALTYASDREDGPQHGYFYLAVGEAGTYTVSLSKPGYRASEVGSFAVGPRGVVSLGELVLQKRLVPTTTRLGLDDRTLTTEQRATATVRVTTDATSRPAGEVAVAVDGDVVRRVDLAGSDRGRLDVRLPRLARGSHTVRATFTPDSPYLRDSTSEGVGVTVRRADSRTARAWVPGAPLLRLAP
jgi:hypothetical protein